jgi:MFS family permease
MTDRALPDTSGAGPIRFLDVLRLPVFSILYLAETQSIVGDQLARVALSVLVFERTGSAVATAVTYAATYVPAVLGGFLLAGIGDRVPRRFVMIGCDVLRAGLFAVMALRGVSTWLLVVLLVLAVLLAPAFSAAQVSFLAATLPAPHFRVATGLRMISNQLAQVLGFAVGGAAVAALGARTALAVNAVTFGCSAILVCATLVRRRRARGAGTSDLAVAPVGSGSSGPGRAAVRALRRRSTVSILWGQPRIRALLATSALAGLFVVPEGLAVPYGHAVGASTAQTGLLLAAIPLGSAAAAVYLVRSTAARRRWAPEVFAGWMAVGCGLPLAATVLVGNWAVAAVLWAISGALAAYQVDLFALIVQDIPDDLRSRAVGAGSAILLGAQGAGLIAFGGLTQVLTVATSLALAGLIGSAAALALTLGPLRRHSEPPLRAPETAAAFSDRDLDGGAAARLGATAAEAEGLAG